MAQERDSGPTREEQCLRLTFDAIVYFTYNVHFRCLLSALVGINKSLSLISMFSIRLVECLSSNFALSVTASTSYIQYCVLSDV